MDYSELNKEAIQELRYGKKQVWAYNNLVEEWFKVSRYIGSHFLHFVSDEKPDWNPQLFKLDFAKQLQSLTPNFSIWQIHSEDTYWREPYYTSWNKDEVCLVQKYQPIYHPMQQEIAKLVLRENKMPEPTPQPVSQPASPAPVRETKQHRYSGLIAELAKNPNQPLFMWSKLKSQWLEIDNLFKEADHWAIGEKPTSPLDQKYRITVNGEILFFELPIGSDARLVEQEIRDYVLHHVKYTYERVYKK